MTQLPDTLSTNDASEPKKPKRSLRNKFKRSIVLLFVTAGLAGVVYICAQMLVGPSEGIIVNAIPENPSQTQSAVELEQFEGVHMTFAYPNTYQVQPATKDNSNSLETHLLRASGMMSKILTVTVVALPSGRLEDDASYLMRSLHPETYKLTPQTIQGEKVIVALNEKDSQQAAFWVHQGKLLTFTITSVTINSEATAGEYQKMLESVRWR
ncbi:MAG TPA: hypothetical protein VF575_02960 [Candidatus Saccharimonadales bacterium]|jgi:hypothetical protein